MKIIINVDKNEAIKSGLDHCGNYLLDYNPADLSQAHRVEITMSREIQYDDNKYYHHAQHVYGALSGIREVDAPTIENLRLILDSRIALRKEIEDKKVAEAAIEKKRVQEIEKWLEDTPVEEFIDHIQMYKGYKCPEKVVLKEMKLSDGYIARIGFIDSYIEKSSDVVKERYKAIADYKDSLFKDAMEKYNEELEKARNETKKRESELVERKQTQIKSFINKHGTDSQKARLKDGLLPQEEISDDMKNHVFASLDDFYIYNKIKFSEVCNCDCDYDNGCSMSCKILEKTELTEEEYSVYKTIKDHAPANSVISIREHYCTTSECDQALRKTGFLVEVKLGEFEFSREYGIVSPG